MKQSTKDLLERAELRRLDAQAAETERKMDEMDRKEAFKALPAYKKIAIYATKALGLIFGILLILALLGAGGWIGG